jgi:diguanylate cyclase (GGDEF)-like protein
VTDDITNRTDGSDDIAVLRAEVARLKDELIRAEWKIAELEARGDTDPMLDILNRRGFERELARSLAFVKRYGATARLVYIDLDGFKAVNDRHGHAAGDELLKAVAQAIVANVRASDVVARFGGDEFGVLMWHIDEDRARIKAADLEAKIELVAVPFGAASLSAGASAGVAALDPNADVAAAIDAADQAMYARKKERKEKAKQ